MSELFRRWILLLLLWPILAGAQEKSSNLTELENHFQNFEYEQILRKGRYFLNDPATSKEDSISIYQLMLSSGYVLQDTVEAGKIISEIISAFPEYRPDPVSVSPKIIEFFSDYKNKLSPAKLPAAEETVVIKPVFPIFIGLNILIPGSGFDYKKHPVKKLTYLGATTASLTALTYFTIKTRQAEKNYLSQDRQHKIDQAYRTYNQYYQNRNWSIVGWALISLLSTSDLIYSDNIQLQYSVSPSGNSLSLIILF